VPIIADAEVFSRAVHLGREVVWASTYGQRYADPAAGRPGDEITLPPDQRPMSLDGIPHTPEGMPATAARRVQIGAWATVGTSSEITYHVLLDADMIEFTIGGRNGLNLEMSKDGLRHCIASFTEALNAFDAARLPHSAGSAG
jgi:hypothetical protein